MARGYFDECAKWGFRIYDRIDVTANMESETPEHAILLVSQPLFEKANELHVETVRHP